MKSLHLPAIAALAAVHLLCGVANGAEKPEPKEPGADDGAKPQIEQWLKSDANGDGKLAREETTGIMARFFERNDADKDGFLDEAELTALATRLAGRSQPNRPANEPGRGVPGAVPGAVPDGVELRTDIPYREGNENWKLDLALPKEKSDSLRPGLVIIHGGGWRSGDKAGGQWRSLPLEYAAKGYVCVSLNYRLTPEGAFPACVEDVKCAVRWLRAHAGEFQLDPGRIGAYGNSAGAHLVAMLGLAGPEAGLEGDGPWQDQSSMVQAVCASATPTDFSEWRVANLLAGPEDSIGERAAKASPVTYVSKKAPPFLLIHGTDDRTVRFEQGKRLAERLEAAGTDVTLLTFEGAGHGVFNQHGDKTGPAMEEFFARTLKAQDGR